MRRFSNKKIKLADLRFGYANPFRALHEKVLVAYFSAIEKGTLLGMRTHFVLCTKKCPSPISQQ